MTINDISRILIIPDLHGRDLWKKAMETKKRYDMVVFLGDLFDHFTIPWKAIFKNAVDVVNAEDITSKPIKRLKGNHDLPYFYPDEYGLRCPGFNKKHYREAYAFLRANMNKFHVAFQMESILFTHAGVTKGFAQHRHIQLIATPKDDLLAAQLNNLFYSNYLERIKLNWAGPVRGGIQDCGGIFWADYSEFNDNLLPGFFQVVGHTMGESIRFMEDKKKNAAVLCTDVLDYNPVFTILDTETLQYEELWVS